MKNLVRFIIFAAVLVCLPSCDITDELLERSDYSIYNKFEQDRKDKDKDKDKEDDTTRGVSEGDDLAESPFS